MPQLIKGGAVVEDQWRLLGLNQDLDADAVPEGKVIIPLQVWLARKQELAPRVANLGVWLNSDELAETLGEDAAGFAVIALQFPGFMDGRAFSTARLLRERYGFKGDLRATGDIIRDQLYYMKRCGFTSFDLPDGTDLEEALASLQDFSESYQPAWDQPLPLFRRRHGA